MSTSATGAGKRLPLLHGQRPWALGFLGGVVFIFTLYQWVIPSSADSVQTFFQSWLPMSALNTSVIWAICAIGLNIVVGYAGLLDLGYVAFWAIGGYVAGWFMSPFVSQMWPSWRDVEVNVFGHPAIGQNGGVHVSFWLVLPLAGLFTAFWGLIIGAPTLRLKSDYLALVTLGFGEIIPEVFRNGDNIYGFNLSNGDLGIGPLDPIALGPLATIPGVPSVLGPFDLTFKFLVYAFLVAVAIFISLRIREGRLGRAWLAIREDELAASMMGVPLMRAKLSAYAVGAFIGGVGGVAFATSNGSGHITQSDFSFQNSITLLAMVILGGMGNVWGVLIGALILSWINLVGLHQVGSVINDLLHTDIDFPSFNFLVFGAILILMMLFRREGLIPESRTRQILREPERGELESVGADLEGDPA
ncbi:MAG: branched-chain amino acid ABC transporter permease [Kineosporiaceae bacterium]|jgi:branched-chain amino acid transport system permease protein